MSRGKTKVIKRDIYGNGKLQCSHNNCGEWKALRHFAKNAQTKTGYNYICKDCKSKENKKNYIKQPRVVKQVDRYAMRRAIGARLNKELNNEN